MGLAFTGLWLEIGIPRFSRFWKDLAPVTFCPGPNFHFWDGFPRGPKRCWPLRLPIGLRFGIFYITSRARKDPVNGFGVCGPMARDRHPAIFRIFGPTLPGPLLFPYRPFKSPIGVVFAFCVAYYPMPFGEKEMQDPVNTCCTCRPRPPGSAKEAQKEKRAKGQ